MTTHRGYARRWGPLLVVSSKQNSKIPDLAVSWHPLKAVVEPEVGLLMLVAVLTVSWTFAKPFAFPHLP